MQLMIIRSGGQTGADRAAMDAARIWNVRFEGWVPAGRTDEYGEIPADYEGLTETPQPDSKQRTEWNVRDADGTLILSHGPLTAGSKLTEDKCHELRKPVLPIDLSSRSTDAAVDVVASWIANNRIRVLNVAGPSATLDSKVYSATLAILSALLNPSRVVLEPREAAELYISETLANFRHWDSLRWGVVEWLVGLVAGLVTITAVLAEPRNIPDIRIGAWLLAVFGGLSVFLQCNLIRYHGNAVDTVNDTIRVLVARDGTALSLHSFLPFTFRGQQSLKTATLWLLVSTMLITLACAYIGLRGPWWLK